VRGAHTFNCELECLLCAATDILRQLTVRCVPRTMSVGYPLRRTWISIYLYLLPLGTVLLATPNTVAEGAAEGEGCCE
jgi:hypothetical protein